MNEIKHLWNEFQNIQFPKNLAEMEKYRFDQLDIDFSLAGCISTFIENGNKLDSGREIVLKKCVSDLDNVIPKFGGEYEKYFSLLHKLGALVIKEIE